MQQYSRLESEVTNDVQVKTQEETSSQIIGADVEAALLADLDLFDSTLEIPEETRRSFTTKSDLPNTWQERLKQKSDAEQKVRFAYQRELSLGQIIAKFINLFIKDEEEVTDTSGYIGDINRKEIVELYEVSTKAGSAQLNFDLFSSKPELEECHLRQAAALELYHDTELRNACAEVLECFAEIEKIKSDNLGRGANSKNVLSRIFNWVGGDPRKWQQLELKVAEFRTKVENLPLPNSPMLLEIVNNLKSLIETTPFQIAMKNLDEQQKSEIIDEFTESFRQANGVDQKFELIDKDRMTALLKQDGVTDQKIIDQNLKIIPTWVKNQVSTLKGFNHFPKLETVFSRGLHSLYHLGWRGALSAACAYFTGFCVWSAIKHPWLLEGEHGVKRLSSEVPALLGFLSLIVTGFALSTWNHSKGQLHVPERRKKRQALFEQVFRNSSSPIEAQHYTGLLDVLCSFSDIKRKYPNETSMPEVRAPDGGDITAEELRDPCKFVQTGNYRANNFILSAHIPTFITAHNSAGKSSIVRAFINVQIPSEIGSFVFARSFSTIRTNNLSLYAPRTSVSSDAHGRFGMELKQNRADLENFESGMVSVSSLDEVAQGTSELESKNIARRLIGANAALGIYSMIITHNLPLAKELEAEKLVRAIKAVYDDPKKRYLFESGVSDTSGAEQVASEVGMDEASINSLVAEKGGDLELLSKWINPSQKQ